MKKCLKFMILEENEYSWFWAILEQKIQIFENFQKFEIFKRFYSQNHWPYEKNSQGIKFAKSSKLFKNFTLMQKKSFLVILEQKTWFWKNWFFWKFFICGIFFFQAQILQALEKIFFSNFLKIYYLNFYLLFLPSKNI